MVDLDDFPDGLANPTRTWAILSVALAIFMTVLDSTIANVALPAIARDFGARPADAIWVVNAYQLGVVICLLPLASLGEIIGFRRVYQAGLAIFVVASLACSLCPTLAALTCARALQGVGAAGVMSVNGGLVRHIYPHRSLGRGIGVNAMVVSTATAVGPSLASAILAVGPWQWLFAVNIPVGLLALALAARVLPANPLSGRRFDWASAALNAATFGFLIAGIDMLVRSTAKLGGAVLAAAGFAAAALLFVREWPRKRPLVPFDLLRGPLFALSAATAVASFAAQTLAFVSLPFHFEGALQRSQVETGLLMTPWPVTLAIVAPAAGWLADRVSAAVLCATGMAVFGLGMLALRLMPHDATALDISLRMAACGFGFALFQAPNNRVLLTAAPRDRAGAAGGMLGTARLTGQTIGAVLVAVFLHLLGIGGEPACLNAAAAFAFAAAGVSLLRVGRGAPPELRPQPMQVL